MDVQQNGYRQWSGIRSISIIRCKRVRFHCNPVRGRNTHIVPPRRPRAFPREPRCNARTLARHKRARGDFLLYSGNRAAPPRRYNAGGEFISRGRLDKYRLAGNNRRRRPKRLCGGGSGGENVGMKIFSIMKIIRQKSVN